MRRKREMRLAGAGAGDTQQILIAVSNSMLGTKFRSIIGYRTGAEMNLAVERREVDGRSTTNLPALFATRPGGGRCLSSSSAGRAREISRVPRCPAAARPRADSRAEGRVRISVEIREPGPPGRDQQQGASRSPCCAAPGLRPGDEGRATARGREAPEFGYQSLDGRQIAAGGHGNSRHPGSRHYPNTAGDQRGRGRRFATEVAGIKGIASGRITARIRGHAPMKSRWPG